MPRTATLNQNAERKIKDALRGVESDTLAKSPRIEMRVTVLEKDEIQRTAKSLGLTVTDYFLSLHRFVRPRLERPKNTAGEKRRPNAGENANG